MLKKVTFKGSPMTLVGRSLKEGEAAPDFKVVDTGLKDISLSEIWRIALLQQQKRSKHSLTLLLKK